MKRVLIFLLCGAALAAGWQAPEWVTSALINAEALAKYFGYTASKNLAEGRVEKTKIAILGRGFSGLIEQSTGDKSLEGVWYLPKNSVFFGRFDGLSWDRTSDRSRKLAQLIWGVTGFSEEGPEFLLLNARGAINFRTSVNTAIEWGAQVILCTESFDFFGNMDGTGPINQLVTKATGRRIIWVQSAGEFDGLVYTGALSFVESPSQETWVRFPQGYYLPLQVDADEAEVQITLNWDAYSPGEFFEGTDLDLDLQLYRWNGEKGELVKESCVRQTKNEDPGENESNLATEKVSVTLKAQRDPYFIAVKKIRGDFGGNHNLRVTIASNMPPVWDASKQASVRPVRLLEAGRKGNIQIPADSPQVITVSTDSQFASFGPTSDGRRKPDILFENQAARFSDRSTLDGPDVAAAHLTAWVAMALAAEPNLTSDGIRKWLARLPGGKLGQRPQPREAGESSLLWFTPTRDELKALAD